MASHLYCIRAGVQLPRALAECLAPLRHVSSRGTSFHMQGPSLTFPPFPSCHTRTTEAVEEMAGLGGIEYPLGGTCVLFGVALMVFLEHLAHIMHGPHSHAPAADSAAAAFTALPSSCTDIEAGATPCGAAKRATAQTSSNCEADPSGVLASDSSVPMKSAMAVAVAEGVASGCCDGAAAGSEGTPAGGAPGDSCYTRASEPGHNHVCVSRGSAGNWFSSTSPAATQAASGSLRLKILAYMFGEQPEQEGPRARAGALSVRSIHAVVLLLWSFLCIPAVVEDLACRSSHFWCSCARNACTCTSFCRPPHAQSWAACSTASSSASA